MSPFGQEVDPAEVGFDADRLARIDAHLGRYVADGRLPGWLVSVARGGRVAHLAAGGWRDVEAGLPVQHDTLFRIYSMTKPITTVAALMLYELGAFELVDPVSRFLPAFGDARIYRSGPIDDPVTEPAAEPIRIWHLMTHTSGLTYGFHRSTPVDAMYRARGFDLGAPAGLDLAGCCDAYASLPVLFEPGTQWNYSVSTDVLGRLVEVVSGETLADFLRDRVLHPLGMVDTGFAVDEADSSRLAALYTPFPGSGVLRMPTARSRRSFRFDSGGGGLIGTAGDYHRFTSFLLGGGELDGVRLLSPRTVAYLSTNHLPGGADLQQVGWSASSETTSAGMGFGLGVAVLLDPAAQKVLSSRGEISWGGAASTGFWVDPMESVSVVFMTQLIPSSSYRVRSELRQLVYQALID